MSATGDWIEPRMVSPIHTTPNKSGVGEAVCV